MAKSIKTKRMRVNLACKADTAFGEDSPAGSADTVVNLRPEGTSLAPVGQLEALGQIGSEATLLATHRTADGVNFITVADSTLYWAGTLADGEYTAVGGAIGTLDGDALTAEALGDFVVVGCSTGDVALRYSGGSYVMLDPGSVAPQLYLSAESAGSVSADVPEYEFADGYTSWQSPLDSDDIAGISYNMRTAYASLVSQAAAERAYVQPVLARYGLRLFDDSYLWISQPVALGMGVQCSGEFTLEVTDDGSVYNAVEGFTIEATAYQIAARAVSCFGSEWDDLIKSVDILVTPEAEPLLTSGNVGYRCETSSTGSLTRYLGLWFKTVDSDVALGEVIGASQWSVAGMITDFDSLRAGDATVIPVVTGLTVDKATISACTRMLSRRPVSRSLLPHNRRLFSAGDKRLLRPGWGLTAAINVDTDYFDSETYEAVAVTTISTAAGEAVTVWSGTGSGRPVSLNPLVAYPDSRAVAMAVAVQLASGEVLEAELKLQPATSEGMAFAAGDSFEAIEFESSDLTELDIPDEENIEEPAAGVVAESVELNPLVTALEHTVCAERVRAIGATMHRSSAVIGTPLYVFTDGGVYALPYRTSSASYAPAVIISRHVIPDGLLPVNSDSALCFATTGGELCAVSQYRVERLRRSVGDVSAMAYCLDRRELWLLSQDGSLTIVGADGLAYSRGETFAGLFMSSADVPVAIDESGGVYSVADESEYLAEVDFLSEPFSPGVTGLFAPTQVTLLLTAGSASVDVTLYGDTGHSCHGMRLCRLSLSGTLGGPVPFKVWSQPVRKLRLAVSGTLSADATIGGVVINYREF